MTDQLALFAPGLAGDLTSITERRRTVAGADSQMIAARFELWWRQWPSGRTRGNKQIALRAWRKLIRDGVPIGELDRQLEHFLAARRVYRQIHDTEAPLMNGSTFLNSKRVQWDEAWTSEDVSRYWPPPGGWNVKEDGAARMRRILASVDGGQ
jgi:hypothetical protein